MELSTYNALDAQCDARDSVLTKVLHAQRLLQEAAEEAKSSALGSIQHMLHYTTILDATQDTIAGHIDAKAWESIIMSTGLYACMHTKARGEWDTAIVSRNVPPLTRENIRVHLGNVHDDRMRFLEEGVVEVFKGLSYDHKSNTPVKFGKKAIIERLHYMTAGMPNTSNDNCSRVDDLARLMCVADGKPEDTTNNTFGALHMDKDYKNTGSTTIETPYYVLKVFKKGTAHIVFKRQDLVDKLNSAIGKAFPNALPAPL